MSKFCGNCGTQLNDEATFCTNCGASLGGGQPAPQQPVNNMTQQEAGFVQQPVNNANPYAQPDYSDGMNNIQYGMGAATGKKTLSKQALIILGGIAAAIIVLVILIFTVFGSNYETPIKNMVKVMESGSTGAYKDLFPSSQIKALESVYNVISDDGLDEYIKEAATEVHDNLVDEYGDNIKVSYKILDKEKLSKIELSDIEDSYSYLSKSKVTEGYTLTLKMTIEGDDDTDTDEDDMQVVKVDGDWVVAGSAF